MNNIARYLLISTLLFIKSIYPEKIILHFDINKTLIAEDVSNYGKTLDGVIIECLAEACTGFWSYALSYEISFTQYVKEFIFPGAIADKELRRQRRAMIHSFFNFLQSTGDDRYDEIITRFYRLKQKIMSQQGKIFQSFYQLIHYLEQEHIDYTIILRTFGQDLSTIAHEISSHTPIVFTWEGHFEQTTLIASSLQTGQQLILETPKEIFNFFAQHAHIKIKDDFEYWHTHQEQSAFGKLFPISSDEQTIKTIFFDDNAYNNIIHLEHIGSTHIPYEMLVHQGIVCPVQTLQAIENDNYFINHLIQNGIIKHNNITS